MDSANDELYYAKYMKYKQKYINLKEEMEGSGKISDLKSKAQSIKSKLTKKKSTSSPELPPAKKSADSAKTAKSSTEVKLVKDLTEKQIGTKRVFFLPIEEQNSAKKIIIFAHGCRIPWGKENVFAKAGQSESNKYTHLKMPNKNSYLNMLIQSEPLMVDMAEFIKYFNNVQDPYADWNANPIDEYRLAYFGHIGETTLRTLNQWNTKYSSSKENIGIGIPLANDESYTVSLIDLNKKIELRREKTKCDQYSMCQVCIESNICSICPDELNTIIVLKLNEDTNKSKGTYDYQIINIIYVN